MGTRKVTDFITSNATLEGATIAAIAAFVLFFLARFAEMLLIWINKRTTHKRIVIGLFQEVKYNLTQLDRFIAAKPMMEKMKEKIKADPNFRPLVIGDEITQFYDAVAASLPAISPSCMMAFSQFYEKLNRLKKTWTRL